MWTFGRRAAAGLLPRSAPPGSAPARAGVQGPTKNAPLYGRRGLRVGTGATRVPSHAVSTRAAQPSRPHAGGERPRTQETLRHARPLRSGTRVHSAPAGPRTGAALC